MHGETPAALSGIANEREFYSDHYLSEIFPGEIRAVAKKWREDAGDDSKDTPDARLKGLGAGYRQFRNELGKLRDYRARVDLQRKWFRRLLEALGHGWKVESLPLEDGSELPILWRCEGSGGVGLVVLETYDHQDEDQDPLAHL